MNLQIERNRFSVFNGIFMGAIIDIINMVFSPLFKPLEGMRPDYAIFLISSVTGVGMLYLYKWTSNQGRLKEVQKKIKAHILEIQLYRTDLGVMMRSLFRVFVKNMTYLWLLLPPAIFLIVLVIVIVVQCYPRFQYRPVTPGEKVLVKAVVKDFEAGSYPVSMSAPEGITVDAGPLPVPVKKEMNWRVSPSSEGVYDLSFSSGGETLTRTLVAGGGLVGVSPRKGVFGFEDYLENPLEVPIPKDSVFESVVVDYPERAMDQPFLLGMNWIIYFFVVSFVIALVWKYLAKVH